MNPFEYQNGELHADEIPVAALARDYGTPLFIYSRSAIRENFRALRRALAPLNPLICYAVKTNSNLAVIATLAQEGAGADIVSAGELFRARRAGIPPEKISFAGVGKTADEIDAALREGILLFTVESEPELDRISARAARMGATARIAIRVNPDVDPRTHTYISTGKKENKFGVDLLRARALYERAAHLPGLEIAGLHMHIGSQILSSEPFAEAARKAAELCAELKARYPTFRLLDIGGGIGIQYRSDQVPLTPEAYAAAVAPTLAPLGLQIMMEPGRFLVGNAGLLVTRVQYVKNGPSKKFIIVDAAMNDLIRPPLYQAYHHIEAVRQAGGTVFGDVVGPVCESGDFFALDRELPAVEEGDLLAIRGAGAYAFSMSSNYNSRPRAAEVMVEGGRAELIRARETFDDLIRGERIPQW
ncbi:MAG: diaminopimelate decarboxylase [Kiritimatiellae bacterium]|nr:diaminopimelate decarboxylase [Kiritimatiellia bacterium]MDW8457768.1 diaminopimelate decarboxylase [Verrucomicrobiota bacterium]